MIYHHGEVDKYELRELTSIRIRFNNFTDGSDKTKISHITEKTEVSLLVRQFDNDHREVFTIYRGIVKEIYTRAIKYNMSKEQCMECILICMDCSTCCNSDIQNIKLSNIVEVNDVDHEYEEIKNTEIKVEEHDPEWKSDPNDKVVRVDISSNVDLIK